MVPHEASLVCRLSWGLRLCLSNGYTHTDKLVLALGGGGGLSFSPVGLFEGLPHPPNMVASLPQSECCKRDQGSDRSDL